MVSSQTLSGADVYRDRSTCERYESQPRTEQARTRVKCQPTTVVNFTTFSFIPSTFRWLICVYSEIKFLRVTFSCLRLAR